MPAADAVVNFGVSTVLTVPSPAVSGVTIVVAAGEGARFPAVPFNVTVMPASGQPTSLTAEIVRVTARTADTLTVTRTQEGSTARTILAGDIIAATITKKSMEDRLSFDAFDGLIFPPELAAATAPPIGARLSTVRMAERSWPTWRRPQGIPQFLSPHLGFGRAGLILPNGASSGTMFSLGMNLPSVGGATATSRAFATTNAYTRRKRLGYVSAVATAATNLSVRSSNNVSMGVGGGSNVGGFLSITRMSNSDAAAVAGARTFIGMSSTGTAPTGAVAEPSTLTNHIGMGHGAANTNFFMYYGGSVAQTPIDLGVNFPANTLSLDMYELILHAPAESTVCHWTVNRYASATNSILFTASGTFLNATPGTTLPAATTPLASLYAWRTNNATALAIALDFHAHYFETDGG